MTDSAVARSRADDVIGPVSAVSYAWSRAFFVRGIGLIYTAAFTSLAVQIRGLVGTNGILPVGTWLAAARDALGNGAYVRLPTLLWFFHGDAALSALAWLGAMIGIAHVITGRAPRAMLACLWLSYLSLCVGGQVFLQFQWDALLLEAGLVAIVYAPRGWKPDWSRSPEPITRWLAWWLCFRLMFLSGITKLLSGDPAWRNLTALDYHYWTQPLPNAVAWYADRLPAAVQLASVAIMFVLEIGAPLLILAPTRYVTPRRVACIALVALQAAIALTGNYGFFNLLSILLCIALLDDGALRRVSPRWLRERVAARRARAVSDDDASRTRRSPRIAALAHTIRTGTIIVMITLGGLAFAREIAATAGRATPRFVDALLASVAPLRSFNGYGLFRVMTTRRPEIVVERSDDGETWSELEFRYKPGDVHRAPPLIAPHMPRLDWQMWFAALDPQRAAPWLLPFLARILDGSPDVAALLDDPASTPPPRFVRLAFYHYTFAPPDVHSASGAWWSRDFVDYLTQPLSRSDLAR